MHFSTRDLCTRFLEQFFYFGSTFCCIHFSPMEVICFFSIVWALKLKPSFCECKAHCFRVNLTISLSCQWKHSKMFVSSRFVGNPWAFRLHQELFLNVIPFGPWDPQIKRLRTTLAPILRAFVLLARYKITWYGSYSLNTEDIVSKTHTSFPCLWTILYHIQ